MTKFHSLILTNAEYRIALVWYPGDHNIYIHHLADGNIEPAALYDITIPCNGSEPTRRQALARMERHIDTLETLANLNSEMASA